MICRNTLCTVNNRRLIIKEFASIDFLNKTRYHKDVRAPDQKYIQKIKKENQLMIGKNIRQFRQEKHVKQETLADAIGVSSQAVSKWETGASDPGQPDEFWQGDRCPAAGYLRQ